MPNVPQKEIEEFDALSERQRELLAEQLTAEGDERQAQILAELAEIARKMKVIRQRHK